MGRIAIIIAVSYGILGGVVVIVIAALVWSSTRDRNRQTNLHKLAEREKTWFGIVVVMLVALLFTTIWFTPYSRSQDNGQAFPVKAEQFAFLVPDRVLHAGVPVRFSLTSADVNHGFAVFNSDNVLLFQVQVMPGETQKYVYTFSKPGLYRVVCLEYCGVGHDGMQNELKVVA